jgi:drug/metabolite transporter (DMT)-like permease
VTSRSVVLTSPTIATVGLSITIPLAILSDFVFFGTLPTLLSSSGALLVIIGFIVISAEERLRKCLQHCFPSEMCWIEVTDEKQGIRIDGSS